MPGRKRCLKSNPDPFGSPFISSELALRNLEHLIASYTATHVRPDFAGLSPPAAGSWNSLLSLSFKPSSPGTALYHLLPLSSCLLLPQLEFRRNGKNKQATYTATLENNSSGLGFPVCRVR